MTKHCYRCGFETEHDEYIHCPMCSSGHVLKMVVPENELEKWKNKGYDIDCVYAHGSDCRYWWACVSPKKKCYLKANGGICVYDNMGRCLTLEEQKQIWNDKDWGKKTKRLSYNEKCKKCGKISYVSHNYNKNRTYIETYFFCNHCGYSYILDRQKREMKEKPKNPFNDCYINEKNWHKTLKDCEDCTKPSYNFICNRYYVYKNELKAWEMLQKL